MLMSRPLRPAPPHPLPRQSGTTLIEVLVSLLILSVGLLGMVGLQTVSLRNTQTAYMRTQATMLGSDIIERMRANPQGVAAGAYHAATGQRSAACQNTTGCSGLALAAHDLAEWQAALADGLPSGSGVVCIDSTPNDGTAAAAACSGTGGNQVVKIWWDDNRDGNANQRTVVSVRL